MTGIDITLFGDPVGHARCTYDLSRIPTFRIRYEKDFIREYYDEKGNLARSTIGPDRIKQYANEFRVHISNKRTEITFRQDLTKESKTVFIRDYGDPYLNSTIPSVWSVDSISKFDSQGALCAMRVEKKRMTYGHAHVHTVAIPKPYRVCC